MLSFFSLFPEKDKNILPVTVHDLPNEDYVMIDDEDFPWENEESIEPELEFASVPQEEKLPEAHHNPEKEQAYVKSPRRVLWESRNTKVFAIVYDAQGQALEVRRVNHGKQLAFWDIKKDAQVYAYLKSQTQELQTQDKLVYKMAR